MYTENHAIGRGNEKRSIEEVEIKTPIVENRVRPSGLKNQHHRRIIRMPKKMTSQIVSYTRIASTLSCLHRRTEEKCFRKRSVWKYARYQNTVPMESCRSVGRRNLSVPPYGRSKRQEQCNDYQKWGNINLHDAAANFGVRDITLTLSHIFMDIKLGEMIT